MTTTTEMKWVEAEFMLDDQGPFEGIYQEDFRWNGFPQPLFTLAETARIAKTLHEASGGDINIAIDSGAIEGQAVITIREKFGPELVDEDEVHTTWRIINNLVYIMPFPDWAWTVKEND